MSPELVDALTILLGAIATAIVVATRFFGTGSKDHYEARHHESVDEDSEMF